MHRARDKGEGPREALAADGIARGAGEGAREAGGAGGECLTGPVLPRLTVLANESDDPAESGLYLPAAHSAHALFHPVAVLYVPLPQSVHPWAPVVSAYLPGAHWVQSWAPAMELYLPASHAVQLNAVEAEYLPVTQLWHVVAARWPVRAE